MSEKGVHKTSISIPREIHELIMEAKPSGTPYATFLHRMMGAILQDEAFIDELYRAMNRLEKRDIFDAVEILIRGAVDKDKRD